MRQTKLIPGRMNVKRTILRPGYAEGAQKPKRIKAKQSEVVFNPPVVCIVLRKAA